jgi:hypothetical protein
MKGMHSMKRILIIGLVSFLAIEAKAQETRDFPASRDTWFSNVGREADGNLGGSGKLKLKSIQEMSLIDFDLSKLKGRIVRSAKLRVRSTGQPFLQRVTVSSIGAEWVEGTSSDYSPQAGSSTHNHRLHPDVPWSFPGSDLCSVILGQGGTTWCMAEATTPDASGFQEVEIDPSIVALRVTDISQGFLLFDDTGTTWKRDGETFTSQHFPNRYVHSRDSNRSSTPILRVELGGEDHQPPLSPTGLESQAKDLPAGEALVSWLTPADQGSAGTVGFRVQIDGHDLPRYLIPLAGKPGSRVRMHLRDLKTSKTSINIKIHAIDGAGNHGKPLDAKIELSGYRVRSLPGIIIPPANPNGQLPRIRSAEVAIIDELDKVQPQTGEMIPSHPDVYLLSNHLWNASEKRIDLYAARNEFVGFQVLIRQNDDPVQCSIDFGKSEKSKIGAKIGKYVHVLGKKGLLPDPIVELAKAPSESIVGAKSQSHHIELFVSHEAQHGDHEGVLRLESHGQSLSLGVVLHVWDFTLPDTLSFLPEMNCYGLPANERDFYRLAHEHRTVLNRLPYSQRGDITDGCAPNWDGKRLDWAQWDRRFGSLLDGSAFADLPRKGVPIEVFYLPLHENWPAPIEKHYNGTYWADRAFTREYREEFIEVARQFAEHFQSKKWNQTIFQGFLNNKVDFKAKGWSRGSAPWLLDEPANFQDFWALRYFGSAFHEGFRQAKGDVKLSFRADISRPQWQRDSLDGLLDYNVVGSAMRKYHRLVMDRKADEHQLVLEYGSANAIEDSNVQPVAWSIDTWSLGCDGVIPWQTIGRIESWKNADPLSLFYPAQKSGPPSPSIRLKAFRRGQQATEYLTLYSQATGEPRWAVGEEVRKTLNLVGERKGTGLASGEDAGRIEYSRLLPSADWELRKRIGEFLSQRHLPARRQIIDLRTPSRTADQMGRGSEARSAMPLSQ